MNLRLDHLISRLAFAGVILLAACDVYRPAAIKQLEVVGEQLGIPVFQMGQIDPVDIAKAAVEHAKKHGNDMVFLDTAGRLFDESDGNAVSMRSIADALGITVNTVKTVKYRALKRLSQLLSREDFHFLLLLCHL